MPQTIVKRVGGKVKMSKWIRRHLPQHTVYCEPFGGSFAVGLSLPKPNGSSYRIVYNDLDRHICNLFRVLREQPAALAKQVDLTPYSRCEFEQAVEFIEHGNTDDVEPLEWARRYVIYNRQSFSGKETGDWSISRNGENISHTWGSLPPLIVSVGSHLKTAFIECSDYRDLLPRWDSEQTVFYCFPPSTLVRTEDEKRIRICDVREGQRLHGGRSVKRVMARVHSGAICEIRIQSFSEPLECTPDHRLIIVPGHSDRQEKRSLSELWAAKTERRACEILPGDYLLVPLGGSILPVEWRWTNTTRKNGKRNLSIDLNGDDASLFKLLGYYAAEGHIHRNKKGYPRGVIFSFGKDEKNTLVEDCKTLLETCFGCKVLLKPDDHPGVIRVCAFSTSVAEFFDFYVSGTACSKHLHDSLMTAPFEAQKHLLINWLKGDGGTSDASRNRFKLTGTSCSKMLADQMYDISLRLGLRPSMKRRCNNWDVYFASEDSSLLGWETTAKKYRSTRRIVNGHILTRVRDILTRQYSGVVYDLDVDGDNLFVAGGILVHNCDPPYLDVEKDFYHVNKEEGFNHKEMREKLGELQGSWAVSYYDSPEIRDLYKGYKFHELKVKKHMQTKAKKDETIEVLIVRENEWAKKRSEATSSCFEVDDVI